MGSVGITTGRSWRGKYRCLAVAATAVPVIAGIAGLGCVLANPEEVGPTISAAKARARVKDGNLMPVDVRSPREWRGTGLPAGAEPVTVYDPDGMPGSLREVPAVVDGGRSRPIALIRAGRVRSARAQRHLRSHGFADVLDVSAGMQGRPPSRGSIERGRPAGPCGQVEAEPPGAAVAMAATTHPSRMRPRDGGGSIEIPSTGRLA